MYSYIWVNCTQTYGGHMSQARVFEPADVQNHEDRHRCFEGILVMLATVVVLFCGGCLAFFI